MSERLLTKCCGAESKPAIHVQSTGLFINICSSCREQEPHVEWVEFCDGCEKPDRYCDCP